METDVRKWNQDAISREKWYKQYLHELQSVKEFISDFEFLSKGRNLVPHDTGLFALHRIIASIGLTAGSIISCYESACIADANVLLRKYRDDLFFYLYISVYSSRGMHEEQNLRNAIKENISRWMQNGLADLQIQEVLKTIGLSPNLKDPVRKYNLQDGFYRIGNRLNDFVHGNGYAYYNLAVTVHRSDELEANVIALVNDMKYITVSFIFLLFLCSPLSVMATDYIDYLELGMDPPEDSQYRVASFVEDFLAQNINLIDKNCFQYLKENTNMKFEVNFEDQRQNDKLTN